MDNCRDNECLALLQKALEDENVGPIYLTYSVFKIITKEFSDEQLIDEGGFGAVYKGTLKNGTVVAVKKLHNKIQILEKNFQSEIDCLKNVKHKNIVRFLGHCAETEPVVTWYPNEGRKVQAELWHRLFCLEYASKGNLSKYISEPSFQPKWRVRYQIIKGICEGVGYLHWQNIIHMDLKPQNILLDDGMVPKITDFGLSRRFIPDQSKTITQTIVGSRRYMAPEFLDSGIISLKTDIYSLGVIIIEILTGCTQECLSIDMVLESWSRRFERWGSHSRRAKQVKLCAEIGMACTDKKNPSNRPHIKDIIHLLDNMDTSNSSAATNIISNSNSQQGKEGGSVGGGFHGGMGQMGGGKMPSFPAAAAPKDRKAIKFSIPEDDEFGDGGNEFHDDNYLEDDGIHDGGGGGNEIAVQMKGAAHNGGGSQPPQNGMVGSSQQGEQGNKGGGSSGPPPVGAGATMMSGGMGMPPPQQQHQQQPGAGMMMRPPSMMGGVSFAGGMGQAMGQMGSGAPMGHYHQQHMGGGGGNGMHMMQPGGGGGGGGSVHGMPAGGGGMPGAAGFYQSGGGGGMPSRPPEMGGMAMPPPPQDRQQQPGPSMMGGGGFPGGMGQAMGQMGGGGAPMGRHHQHMGGGGNGMQMMQPGGGGAVHGMPAAAGGMPGAAGFYQGGGRGMPSGPPEMMQAARNPMAMAQQQQQYMAMMQQQQMNGHGGGYPAMGYGYGYGRPAMQQYQPAPAPAPYYYQPMVQRHPNDNMITIFSDDNPNGCTVM